MAVKPFSVFQPQMLVVDGYYNNIEGEITYAASCVFYTCKKKKKEIFNYEGCNRT